MALYEIQTLMTPGRVSLISYGDFPSDLAAILAARALMRRGEAIEVWRGENLVYRMGRVIDSTTPRIRSGGVRHPFSRPQQLVDLAKTMIVPIKSWPSVIFRPSDFWIKTPTSKAPPKR
jgi:hypothetical protein